MLDCISCKIRNTEANKESGVSFHRFPRDPVIKRRRCDFVKKENVTQNVRLCSNHFQFTDFMRKGRKTFLKKDALPKFNAKNFTPDSEESGHNSENEKSLDYTLTLMQGAFSNMKSGTGKLKVILADNLEPCSKRLRDESSSTDSSMVPVLNTTDISETLTASDTESVVRKQNDTTILQETNETQTASAKKISFN